MSLWSALSDERSSLSFASQNLHYFVVCQYIHKYSYFICLINKAVYIHYIQSFCQYEFYSNLRPTNSSSLCHGSLRHLSGRIRDLTVISSSSSYIATDSQSASASCYQASSGIRDQFFFLLEIFFRQLRFWYFVVPSLTRGWVSNLQLMLISSAQSRSGLSPTGLKIKIEVNLRPTVGCPVCLGVRRRSGTCDQWHFLQTVACLLFCSSLSDEKTGM
jgi:hypothetical protein